MKTVRGMMARTGLGEGFNWRATISRMQLSGSGLRTETFLVNWPCDVANPDTAHTLRDAFEGTTHILTGPEYPGKLLQAGDVITRLTGPDGVNYIRPGKNWSVLGRRHYHGSGDTDHQTIYVREEI